MAERFKKSYPFVNIVFGTHVHPPAAGDALHHPHRFQAGVPAGPRAGKRSLEGIPTRRDGTSRAWVTVMLRLRQLLLLLHRPLCAGPGAEPPPGGDRQRVPGADRRRATRRSPCWGRTSTPTARDLEESVNFAELLRQHRRHPRGLPHPVHDLPPQGRQPRSCSTSWPTASTVAHYIHLPFQSGNDRVLTAMNRRYTREQYLELIRYARSVMPDVMLHLRRDCGLPRRNL